MQERSFFDIIARDVWDPMQDQLGRALRMEIHIISLDGQDLCPPSEMSPYRALLDQSPTYHQDNRAWRRRLISRLQRKPEILVELANAGRLMFAVPVMFGHQLVAVVLGGGVVEQPLPADLVQDVACRYGVDPAALAAVAPSLPVAERETCCAAGRVIGALLAQVTNAVHQREKAKQQAVRLEMLTQVGSAVTSSLDLIHTLDTIIDVTLEVLDGKAVVVALHDDKASQDLRIRVGKGVSDEFLQARFQLGRGLLGHVASTGEPVNVPDMLRDPRNAYVEHDEREGLRALLAVPLRDGEDVLGVLGVFAGEPHRFTSDDEHVLAVIANYAATALLNARLYEQMRQAYRELGLATRRLQQAQEQLFHTDRLVELGRVAGGAAHEMKNTIGGIIGAAATVRDRFEELPPEDVRELLAAIADEGWRLRDSIDTVRRYGKAGKVNRVACRVRAVVDEAVRLLRFDAQLTTVPFIVEADPELECIGDRERLKQVLINLLRNAAEATRGMIDRAPEVRVVVEARDERVLIHIEDNGSGIPADKLSLIWEPFYTTKGDAGTGLGLDLVRQMVRAQDGEIEVRSEVGHGSTFTVALPRVAVLAEA